MIDKHLRQKKKEVYNEVRSRIKEKNRIEMIKSSTFTAPKP